MLELLLGLGLGAIAFTEKGHEVGNKLGEMSMDAMKKVASRVKESAKQSPGTAGDNNHLG